MTPLRKIPQVVVITGASAGVGRATVREFAKSGAKIGLIARGREALEAAKSEVENLGGQAIVIPIDVAEAEAVEKAAEQVENTFGPIDIWINDAMVSVFSPVKEMTAAEYKRVTDVTYLGYVYGTLSVLKRMLPRNHGVIIQVSSALGYRSIPLQSAYCAAKHAIVGFTESLRTELLHDASAVQVCLVDLPAVNTPQFSWVKSRLHHEPQPVPPVYQPEVIARAIHYTAQYPRKTTNIGISTLIAKAAEVIAPNFADRYLATHGYSSQQTLEKTRRGRKNNLWVSRSKHAEAHGSFDSRARDFSVEFSIFRNRYVALAATCALLAFSFSLIRKVSQ